MLEAYRARGSDGWLLALLTACCLCLALTLGGGTRSGFLSDALLQFATVPLLACALLHLSGVAGWRHVRAALLICVAIAAVPALQLIPLPASVWQKLPGRSVHVESFGTLGLALPWLPTSVSPRATALSLASLVVPIAIFIATCQLSFHIRRKLSLLVIGVGMVSVLLGLLQVAQGPSSPLRLFEFTNPSEAVGIFANRNHFSALLYCLLLFAAAWTLWYARAFEHAGPTRRFAPGVIVPVIAGFAVVAVLVAEQAMARSRAGLGLTMLALLGAFLIGYSMRRHDGSPGKLARRVLVGALALGVVFSMQLALYRVLERFEVDPLADSRVEFARVTFAAAKAYVPLGSGLGTFGPVYAQFEQPKDVLTNAFVNRAHNDLLELLLEAGIVGALLLTACVLWFLRRLPAIWGSSAANAATEAGEAHHAHLDGGPRAFGHLEIDRILARAATVVVALLVAHSFVDYPLRTGAMSAVMAFALALLVPPPASPEDLRPEGRKRAEAEHVRRSRPAPDRSAPKPAPVHQPPQHRPIAGAGEQRTPWNSEWPEAWLSPAAKRDKKPGEDDGNAT